jgi:hypothetical protein
MNRPEDEQFEFKFECMFRVRGKHQYFSSVNIHATDRGSLQRALDKMASNGALREMMQKAILTQPVTQN